ncbi:histidine phosphatase family protein [Pseudomonas sp. WS 5414]|nr:histidine phosphatase family protein [Pseudomonas sp. WS 5414]
MNSTIILMRHGQPEGIANDRISALDMQGWIQDYDRSAITAHPAPPSSLQLAASAAVIVSSSAPRALASVQALGLQPTLVDPLFCEAQLPYGPWRQPRLSPITWAVILRILWCCGYSRHVETATAARSRAAAAALQLQSLTQQGPVLLLGHGWMNRLIGKQLAGAGWRRQERAGSRYWSATVYRRSTA